MGNQLVEPAAQTARSTYQKAVFVIAFVILFSESAILMVSVLWDNAAPQWASPILEQRGTLLGVAAAIALLLSLLLAWNPTGPAKYATLSSGVLGFAAATYSLEPNDLSLGLALLSLALPLFVIMLPNLRWPESKDGWVALLSPALFFVTAAMFTMLGIKPVTEAVVVAGGIRGLGGLVATAVIVGIGITFVIIVLQLAVQATAQGVSSQSWLNRLRSWITWRRRENRAERRRRQKRRR